MIRHFIVVVVFLAGCLPVAAAELPRVEVPSLDMQAREQAGKTLREIVPPAKVKHIVLVEWHDDKEPAELGWDHDRFIARAFASDNRGEGVGIDAMERRLAKYLLVTDDGLCYLESWQKGIALEPQLSAVILWGQGFGCRFAVGKTE